MLAVSTCSMYNNSVYNNYYSFPSSAMHALCPAFRKATFSEKVKVCKKLLRFCLNKVPTFAIHQLLLWWDKFSTECLQGHSILFKRLF